MKSSDVLTMAAVGLAVFGLGYMLIKRAQASQAAAPASAGDQPAPFGIVPGYFADVL